MEAIELPVKFPIKLGQAVKLTGVAEDGVEAKVLISSGDVLVDGEVCTRRGATLTGPCQLTVDAAGGREVFNLTQR